MESVGLVFPQRKQRVNAFAGEAEPPVGHATETVRRDPRVIKLKGERASQAEVEVRRGLFEGEGSPV